MLTKAYYKLKVAPFIWELIDQGRVEMDNVPEAVLISHHVGPQKPTEVIRPGSKPLYTLSPQQ